MSRIQPYLYDELFANKKETIRSLFDDLYAGEIDAYASAKTHYRMRAEFRLWHKDNSMHYVMFEKGKKNSPIFIESFPQAHESIANLMFPLLDAINTMPLVAARLFQMDFLTTQAGEVLVSLIYHKNLSDEWEEAARQLQDQFKIKIIGRARNQKRILKENHVTETLMVNNTPFIYQQIENSFSQPNAKVCEKMIEWVLAATPATDSDLLELYCGNGNFTLPLATRFRKVLATEMSKASIHTAKINADLNHIENVVFVRLSSDEVAQAFAGEREFRRLADIDLQEYQFSTVFVDPPRAGLDQGSIELIKEFNTILYISCNPLTLRENILQLDNFKIEKLAMFDQFPYTDHVECGAILRKIS